MSKYHIETKTIESATTSIQFLNIPQNYTDLVAVCSTRSSNTGIVAAIVIRPNGTNGYIRRLVGTGSTRYSDQVDPIAGLTSTAGNTANTFGNASFYIPNYSVVGTKSVSVDSVQERNATESYIQLAAGLWGDGSSAAITSLTFDVGGTDNLVAGSTISLYGVRRGSDGITATPPYATGGTITSSGGYTIHTFNSSGTFTPTKNLTNVEYLVIGGGGGGGQYLVGRGGGGAGGYRSSVVGESSGGGAPAEARLSLTSGTNYTVTVGAGGGGGNGSDSAFSTITSLGGGYGNGILGGSGGANSGAGTANQGFAAGGGNGISWGGGGGAGSAGTNASPYYGGSGGAGVSSSITGVSVARAGGGGGGGEDGGGSGQAGGGNGGRFYNPIGGTSATANSGSGGGGTMRNDGGGSGGSGVVIIRYPN